jgi:DNA-binding NarL/FixJ family response regulator
VLIADDQRVVREGLALVVGLLDGVEVVGAADDGAQAVELAGSLRPDVVLMDLHMPVLDGIQATRRIRADQPETQVLILSTYAEDSDLLPALQAGALGYLTKDASAEDIHLALIDVTTDGPTSTHRSNNASSQTPLPDTPEMPWSTGPDA